MTLPLSTPEIFSGTNESSFMEAHVPDESDCYKVPRKVSKLNCRRMQKFSDPEHGIASDCYFPAKFVGGETLAVRLVF